MLEDGNTGCYLLMRLQTLMPSREPKDPHSVEDLENRGMMIKGEIYTALSQGCLSPGRDNLLHTPRDTCKFPIPLWSAAFI